MEMSSAEWEGHFLKPINVHLPLLSPNPPSQHDVKQEFLFPMDMMSPPITPHDYINPMMIQTDSYTIQSPPLMQSSPSMLNSSPQLLLHHSPQLSMDSPQMMMGYDYFDPMNMIPAEYDTQWMQPNISPMLLEKSPMQRLKNSASDGSLASWNSGQFQCNFPGCTKVFSKQTNLKSHSRIHHTERNYACQDCGACFRRSHDLKRHQRSLHSDVKPFGCSRCGKRFSRMDALKRHTARVTSACYIAGLQ